MSTPNVSDAIRELLEKGKTKEAIYEQLLAEGLSLDVIESGFSGIAAGKDSSRGRRLGVWVAVVVGIMLVAGGSFFFFVVSRPSADVPLSLNTNTAAAPEPVVQAAPGAVPVTWRPWNVPSSPVTCETSIGVKTLPKVIAADTVLSPEGGVYVIEEQATVEQDVTVTLQPCTVVKFKQGAGLTVLGTLTAHGADGRPIFFTAWLDDVGGDSNGDSDATSAATSVASSRWHGIRFENGSTGSFSGVRFRYGGPSFSEPAIMNDGGTVSLADVILAQGESALLQTSGSLDMRHVLLEDIMNGIDVAGGTAVITDSLFSGQGMFAVRNQSLVPVTATGNWWGSPTGPAAGFSRDGVVAGVQGDVLFDPWIVGDPRYAQNVELSSDIDMAPVMKVIDVAGDISRNATWGKEKGVYAVRQNVRVQPGMTLTIEAGTVVKFGSSGMLLVEEGSTLLAQGTAKEPITFTSLYDDVGTNTDQLGGTSREPKAGDWMNISFFPFSKGVLTHAVVRYGGGGDYAITHKPQVHIGDADVRIEDSAILNGKGAAVFVAQSKPTFLRTEIAGNKEGIWAAEGSQVLVNQSSLWGNDGMAIFADGTSSVDARSNWWGASSSPRIVSADDVATVRRSQDGVEAVAGKVDVASWLTSRPNLPKFEGVIVSDIDAGAF